MGSFCGSGKPATATTNQSQTYSANPAITGAGTQALNMAQTAASSPFQMPAAPVAGFNPLQTQGFDQYAGVQGMTDPYYENAAYSMGQASQSVNQNDINQYMNPYAGAALDSMQKYIFDPQRVQTMGSQTQLAGGVGASRLALASQNLDKTQADALSQAQAGFYQQAITAAQNSKQQAMNSAQGWASLGNSAQGANLQATGALVGAGNQQQALSQAQLNSPYQQALAQIAYPYQNAQFLAGVTGGLAPAFGGTTTGQGTTQQYAAQASPLNQILGFGLAGAGVAGSVGYNPFGSTGGTQGNNGLSTDVANNGSGIYTGNASYPGFGYRGGNVDAFADGGEVDGEQTKSYAPWASAPSPWSASPGVIPHADLPMGGGQNTGAHLDLNPKIAQQSGSSGGSALGNAANVAKMAMMFMNRGGAAEGGSVNPWDFGRGYAPGGEVEFVSPDDFNRIDEASVDYSRPLERPAPNLGMWPFNSGQADYKGDVTMFSPAQATPAAAPPVAAQVPPSIQQAPSPTQGAPIPPSMTPNNVEAATPAIPAYKVIPGQEPYTPQPAPRPTSPVRQVPRAIAGPGLNRDMRVEDFMSPSSQRPYPDALNRDWGQKATRSPWMSLVDAGAKIASTPGPTLSGLALGMQAGAKTLDKQREELRTEQQINQKADELFRHARSELNKYTRKTPHELATETETARYHDILSDKGNLIYAGPAKDEAGMGYFYDRKNLDANGQPRIMKMPMNVGEKPGTAGKEGTRQWAYRTYKEMYPNDPQGASDILRGHKTLSAVDVRKAADSIARSAMSAQNIQPQDTEEWLSKHKELSDQIYKKRMDELAAERAN